MLPSPGTYPVAGSVRIRLVGTRGGKDTPPIATSGQGASCSRSSAPPWRMALHCRDREAGFLTTAHNVLCPEVRDRVGTDTTSDVPMHQLRLEAGHPTLRRHSHRWSLLFPQLPRMLITCYGVSTTVLVGRNPGTRARHIDARRETVAGSGIHPCLPSKVKNTSTRRLRESDGATPANGRESP